MASPLRRLRPFLIGVVIGVPVGYLQGSAAVNIVRLLGESPVGGIVGEATGFLNWAIATYGIWAYIAASGMKGLLLFFLVPAETVTPLFVLEAAETPLHVAGIAVVGAAAITATNFVVYLLSRLLGERIFTERDSATWRFVEWLIGRHGRLSMYLLRITPWIGGWAAIPAGIVRLNVRTFLIYSFLGFLTYEGLLGFAAYYGIKTGTVSVPILPALVG